MALSTEEKIEELDMQLLDLQQIYKIPEVNLEIHPKVVAIIKKCEEEGKKPNMRNFGKKVEDDTFLDELQSGVNCWIGEIQKVLLLRDLAHHIRCQFSGRGGKRMIGYS